MWSPTAFLPLSRGHSQATFLRESQMFGDDSKHLYSRLHHVSHLCPKILYIYIYIIYSIPAINWSKHYVWLNFSINLHLCLQPWFWCTWHTHGAIVFMNRPKERTLQTEIEQWNRSAEDASICNFLFLFNKENIYVKNGFLTCCQLITLIQFSCLIKYLNMMHHSDLSHLLCSS